VFAACGSSEPPVEPARHLANHAIAREPAAPPPTPPPEIEPAKPPPSNSTLVDTFGGRLRTAGSIDLTSLITGPVVVLDLDAASLTTLCGNAAGLAARDWAADLADPKRMVAKCMVASDAKGFACIQVRPDVLGVVFEGIEHPHLVGAYVGTVHSKLTQVLVNQFRTLLATATCP
jgi:hypothetical protein